MHGPMYIKFLRHYSSISVPTNKLTAWSRVLLEKLLHSQLVKKFPAFCGTWKFITAHTRPTIFHLSQFWAISIQSIFPSTSWRSLLIFSHLCLGLVSGFFPTGFHTKPCTLNVSFKNLLKHTCSSGLLLNVFVLQYNF